MRKKWNLYINKVFAKLSRMEVQRSCEEESESKSLCKGKSYGSATNS